ncbi:MAG: DsbA family protein [Chloroflexaceae bacterium]|nr:DsbA family protein [Chloroflexaceae bacterium]
MATLYYVIDPMCSWCWGFRPVMDEVLLRLPDDIQLRYIMGGLAPDTERPMPALMQQKLQDTWRLVAERTGATFNFEFWKRCKPRRATYPANRAVLAAGLQGKPHVPAMIAAIQQAYYVQARNPSDTKTLIELAGEIGLDAVRFARDLESQAVQERFEADLALARHLGIQGFPSLLLEQDGHFRWIAYGYAPAAPVVARLQQATATLQP